MRVLFRADASAGIGSGHWIRCRSLARSLRSEGADVRFCGRAPAGVFRETLAREFRLIALPSASEDSINPSKGCWIDVTEHEDARLTCSAVEADGSWRPEWIVVDHYGLSSLWHQCLRDFWTGVRIGVIDDLADRPHDADLLVDHNIFEGDLAFRYQHLLSSDRETRLCLGPQFALIDPFYAGFQGALPPRQSLMRLLISLGGGCHDQLLVNILQALIDMPDQLGQIQLVQGGFASDSPRIQSLCDQLGVQTLNALPSLAPLMASADASIGAGGTSTWERLCLGLPCITYSVASNQEAYSQELAQRGLIEFLGSPDDFDASRLQQILLRWQNEPDYLKRQSSQGMALVDGHGCTRVARLMAAVVKPELWSELQPRLEVSPSIFHWRDDICFKSAEDIRSSPLTSLDFLEINRHCLEPYSAFLDSRSDQSTSNIRGQRITVVSSKNSWMNNHIPRLLEKALAIGCSIRWIHDHRHLQPGDICFLLSYGRVVSEEFLALNRHNLVVHASALPKGKGWSPMTWQILEGATEIPLTLFEAAADLDAGPIYAQEMLRLQGTELVSDWQHLQAEATIRLCSSWLRDYPMSSDSPQPQIGEESCYARRRPEDSRLDPHMSLVDQFSLLQVVDNDAYPAFFELRGKRYLLQIEGDRQSAITMKAPRCKTDL